MENNNNNTAIAKTAESQAIVNRKGAIVGTRSFFGTIPAKDIREAGKALGLKGNGLTAFVNNALADEGSNRVIMGVAWVQAKAQAGFIPDYGDDRMNKKGGGSATLRMVKPNPIKVKDGSEARAAALELLGLTEDDIAALAK